MDGFSIKGGAFVRRLSGHAGNASKADCAGRKRPGNARRRSGQMAVEFAVTIPVMAAVAFIVLNGLIFAGDCASFDIAARDAVRMQADDGRQAQGCAEVRARIEQRLGKEYESVEVTCEETGAGHIRYTVSALFAPPFLEGASVFGVQVPPLRHEVEFTISPYRKGVVL